MSSLSSVATSVEGQSVGGVGVSGRLRSTTHPDVSVQFRVDDTRRTSGSSSSSSSDHTEYRVSVTTQFVECSDSVLVVWRRYSQFLRLYRALQCSPRYERVMQHCPEFPPKVAFARFNPQVVEHRIKRFQALLDFVAFNRTLLESSHLLDFLADTSNDPAPSAPISAAMAAAAAAGDLPAGRRGGGDAQDDSLRAFALGRLYDYLNIDDVITPLQGRTISFLSLSSSAADTVPLLAVALQMSAAGLRVQVISLDHNKAIVEAHKLKFLSLSRGDTYVSLKELGTRTASSHSIKPTAKDTRLVEISPTHVCLLLLLPIPLPSPPMLKLPILPIAQFTQDSPGGEQPPVLWAGVLRNRHRLHSFGGPSAPHRRTLPPPDAPDLARAVGHHAGPWQEQASQYLELSLSGW